MSRESVVEVATFRLHPGTDRAQFLAAAGAADTVLRRMSGFLSRELLEGEDGEWLDLLHWSSQENAQRSLETLSLSPEAQPFLALIDPQSVRLRHYRTIDLGQ